MGGGLMGGKYFRRYMSAEDMEHIVSKFGVQWHWNGDVHHRFFHHCESPFSVRKRLKKIKIPVLESSLVLSRIGLSIIIAAAIV